jgi:DNA phosphorothioation-dependent restriction protein DptH
MSALRDHIVETLAERVLGLLRSRGPGHCLQIAHVPLDLADAACRLVAKELREPDLARVVVPSDQKPKAWQSPPAKIVEIRNASDETGGRLALFVPAGQRVAAEDSFGRSTFEVLELGDLYGDVAERLRRRLQAVAPTLAERAEAVVGAAAAEDGVSDRDVAAYLARVVTRPVEEELGRALVEVGLLPDASVSEQAPEDVGVRIARNSQLMRALTELSPPADRIQSLSIPAELADASQVASELTDALQDGTVDRHELARRLDRDGREDPLDFGPVISALGSQPDVRELSILKLSGDFKEGSEPPTITKTNARVQVKYRCRPAPASIAGLKQLRLELVHVGERLSEVAETGVEAAKSGKSLSAKTDGTWSLRLPTDELESGIYRLRLRAIDADNFPLKEALSEPFKIHEEIEEVDLEVRPITSIAAARVDARIRNPDSRAPDIPRITLAEAGGADERTVSITVRFDEAPGRWEMHYSRVLALVERYTFQAPRSLARYRVSLRSNEIEETLLPDPDVELPEEFLDARETLLAEIERSQYPREGAAGGPLVGLADLRPLEGSVQRYVEAWTSAIQSAASAEQQRALLDLDQVTFDDSGLGSGVLIGPTHPLRLAWLTRHQTTIDEWLHRGASSPEEAAEVATLVDMLTPANLPHVVYTEHRELRHLETIDMSWGLWSSPVAPDVSALANIVRAHLGLPRSTGGGVRVADVVQRVRRYLTAHPYVELLEINFVHPGAGELVLQTLLALQSDPATESLRYIVRLFATELSRTDLGRALDEFMADPESLRTGRKDAADAFLASTDDPLTPKLTYSKHRVRELLDAPERFPAHLTFFLDWFGLDVVPAPPLSDRRSFFARGLIVDPVSVYRPGEGDLNPQWDEHVIAPDTASDWFVRAYAACEHTTAQMLDPDAQGTVPAVRLVLDRVRRSVLDAVHRYSDWVVVIDPVFTDDYLDSPPLPGESPRYLIDSVDPGALEATRRIMISTRSRAELGGLLRPVLQKYDLDVADDRIDVLLDALRALSAGLPLKLLNNPTQAVEALSLALATVYLAAEGILRHAIVIPLDLHHDLFREEASSDDAAVTDLKRTDLAIVQLDADERRLGIHLVEVKARGQLPEVTPLELIEHIDEQLENSRAVLRRRLFSAEVRQRHGSLAGALMVRRLTRLLSRYTERGLRYGFLEPDRARASREFVISLDRGFSIGFSKHALLFDLDGPSRPAERIEEVRVQRIGREQILDLLNRTQTPVGTQQVDADPEHVRTVLGLDAEPELVEEVPPADVEKPTQAEKPLGGEEGAEPEAVTPEAPSTTGTAPDEGPAPGDVLLLGATPSSAQFGIIGRVGGSGRDVAFDTDGTNVVSVFGVQGSGKSYTVGNLIEAALLPQPELNRLPHPLAAIVFHYSTDQTYLPEFAAMSDPNDDPRAVELLRREYSVEPTGVADVQVLVPEALLRERQAEFPGIEVRPLLLATRELAIDDWKLLMGVEGGDQLYVKAMTNLFRSLRSRLSLDSLRESIASGSLTQQQKTLAETRIAFAEAFATDAGGAGQYVRPGGLLIVDVRDPLIEQEEALALFMVLLRLFSQARDPEGRLFNKLIVFDEAHKYMGNPRLTNAIVQSVREMRHKGTSVVIASQNPPSVPREVIELSSVVIAHKFTSPQWLEHVRKVNAAFGRDLTPPQLAMLPAGEAFVWSSAGAEEFRRPQRVRMRARLSLHGGATRRAGGD